MSYRSFTNGGSTSRTSNLNQLIDVIQEDISGSSSRRKYQVFITGGIGPGVTSSLYQTVYDQDFSLQTSNAMFDLSVGLFFNDQVSNTVSSAPGFSSTATIGTGQILSTTKLLFSSESIQMREKVDIYRSYAGYLLGDPDAYFCTNASSYPAGAGVLPENIGSEARIDEALFVNIKRLFARDKIRKETFALRLFQSASISGYDHTTLSTNTGGPLSDSDAQVFARQLTVRTGSNLGLNGLSLNAAADGTTAISEGSNIIADINSNIQFHLSPAGDVARILDSSNINEAVGLIFYDAGIAVLDMKRVFWRDQHVMGVIDGMNSNSYTLPGITHVSSFNDFTGQSGTVPIGWQGLSGSQGEAVARFIPDFIVSASIDNIIDHISMTRFGSGSLTAMAFQNQTRIQSQIYFCKATHSEYNYSSNPTFIDESGNLNVISDSTDPNERSFTFITTVCLLDETFQPVAVAKLNRPVEKNDETELTIRVRLDF